MDREAEEHGENLAIGLLFTLIAGLVVMFIATLVDDMGVVMTIQALAGIAFGVLVLFAWCWGVGELYRNITNDSDTEDT